MYPSRLSQPWLWGCLLVVCGWGGPGLTARAVEPLSVSQVDAIATPIQFRQPNTDEASDPLDRPQGGGSRRPCQFATQPSSLPCVEQELMAVLPQSVDAGASLSRGGAWGQTLAAHPTLWFYVPYAPQSIDQAVFQLLDSEGTIIVEETLLELPGTGLVGYQPRLPQGLAVGQTYRWHLLVSFDQDHPSGDAYISGRIKRIASPPELAQQLQTTDLVQKAKALATAGIWYDMLSTVIELQPQQPEYLRSLLQNVGLGHLSQAPIVR